MSIRTPAMPNIESMSLTSEEDESMSTTPESTADDTVVPERYVVRLAVPVDTTDPEAAVELVMQDIAYYGLKQYIYLVAREETGDQWYVGERGVMSAEEVDEAAGVDPEDVEDDLNDPIGEDDDEEDDDVDGEEDSDIDVEARMREIFLPEPS